MSMLRQTLNDECGGAIMRKSFPLVEGPQCSNWQTQCNRLFCLKFLLEVVLSGNIVKNHIDGNMETVRSHTKEKAELVGEISRV